ncbi:unnamed protein product [Mytilus coruscus]|uniref:Uncharacterized protein n=1 Tax=Mytilus coruscus TaxID=42192 RepID=A0A6J8B130_MYTCO|nr:unnamed protein product [Mytilus coruscus]
MIRNLAFQHIYLQETSCNESTESLFNIEMSITATTNVTYVVASDTAEVICIWNVTSLTSLPNHTPRIPTLFGEQGKGEASYDLWRYEVDSLLKSTFVPHIVGLLIRRSLWAEKLDFGLGSEASLYQLLTKLEVNYGFSIQHDKLTEEFYSAIQNPNKEINSWAKIYYYFYIKNFTDIQLQFIHDIECADDYQLPCDLYIEVSLNILSKKGKTNAYTTLPMCIFLIVPDSKYNSIVTVLVGTNILASCIDQLDHTSGDKYLQSVQLYTPVFMALRWINLREKQLKKQNHG